MGTKLLGAAASNANDAVRKSELDAAIAGVSAGASVWTAVEVDFGTTPTPGASFTITDAGVSPTSDVAVAMSSKVATGRVGNDAEWDGFNLSALAGSGSFVLTALAVPGPVVGSRTFLYQIG